MLACRFIRLLKKSGWNEKYRFFNTSNNGNTICFCNGKLNCEIDVSCKFGIKTVKSFKVYTKSGKELNNMEEKRFIVVTTYDSGSKKYNVCDTKNE